MTRKQFTETAQEFWKHANMCVKFKKYIPSADKTIDCVGIMKGIGMDANKDCFIIAQNGASLAINFADVEKVCNK